MISRWVAVISLTVIAAASPTRWAAAQQPATDLVARANREFDARQLQEALSHYQAALAIEPRNYDALWRGARANVELGEYDPSADHRTALYKTAEQQARLAVQVNPGDAEGHFTLAMALGRTALSLGVRDRIKYAGEVREQALACLKINPQHPGCLHVMGVWNDEVMRLSGFTRMIAKNFLGGGVFSQASWDAAQRYLIAAVTNEPRRIVHRLDLGRVYVDLDKKDKARTQFEAVINGELIDYNDQHYKADAQKALQKL
jgi:tetratricopeptide (TPR) repeat protein